MKKYKMMIERGEFFDSFGQASKYSVTYFKDEKVIFGFGNTLVEALTDLWYELPDESKARYDLEDSIFWDE